MSAVVHDFRASLAKSAAQADAPWWSEVYRLAFPTMRAMVSVRDDGWAQRGGIDRVITLKCGRSITIDEKVRDKDWPDILLERWSDEARKIPGWVQKPLACDFIAYAFIPSSTCYLLPTLTLQKAWRDNGREWVEKYGSRNADNGKYITVSTPVPRGVLFSAMADAMKLSWAA